jgi:hypothetical protein
MMAGGPLYKEYPPGPEQPEVELTGPKITPVMALPDEQSVEGTQRLQLQGLIIFTVTGTL